MNLNATPSLADLAKEMLFNWFTPGRERILVGKNDSVAHFLDLGDPPTEDDPCEFYKKQLRAKHAEFSKELRGESTLLDRNLGKLCQLLHLNEIEHQVLKYFCIAEVSDEIHWLTKSLEHPNTRSFSGQVSDCLALPHTKVFHLLKRDGRLVQSGLVYKHRLYPGGRPGGNGFSITDHELAFHLLEEDFNPSQMTRSLGTAGKPSQLTLRHFEHIKPSLDILIPYLKQILESKRPGVNILIHGVPGTGKTELGRLLGQVLNCGTFEPTFLNEEGDPISGEERFSRLRCTLSFLRNEHSLILCDEAEDLFPEPRRGNKETTSHKLWVHRLLEENQNPIVWLSNSVTQMDQATLRRFDFVIELRVPGRRQRQEILEESAGEFVSASCIKVVASNEQLAPAIITKAAGILKEVSPVLSRSSFDSVFQQLLSQDLKAQGHLEIDSHFPQSPLAYTPEYSKASVNLSLLTEGLRANPEARICLEGPPGTGKTVFGKWLAESLDRPLHVHRMSDLSSMFVGETEQQIAKAFQNAQHERAILMLDEVDSLLCDRSDLLRKWEVSQVNEMLTQMESFHSVLIATTNRASSLDPASKRRFDLTIALDYLDPTQIQRLFEQTCQNLALKISMPPPSFSEISNATPGDFATLHRRHRFSPFSDSGSLADALISLCAQKKDRPTAKTIGFKSV